MFQICKIVIHEAREGLNTKLSNLLELQGTLTFVPFNPLH
jgi:hypothetical protein